jgi:hypothetical protein
MASLRQLADRIGSHFQENAFHAGFEGQIQLEIINHTDILQLASSLE